MPALALRFLAICFVACGDPVRHLLGPERFGALRSFRLQSTPANEEIQFNAELP